MAGMGVTFNSFMSKQFNTKARVINSFFYTANAAFFAMVFFVMSAGGKLHFTYKFLPYSIAFGITYGITNFFTLIYENALFQIFFFDTFYNPRYLIALAIIFI